jgi:predicted MFS family arabinose efflux permease
MTKQTQRHRKMHAATASGPPEAESTLQTPTTSGVILPVALTLAVQAVVSMSSVAIPVLTPVAAGELDVPPSFVGIFMSLLYLGATVSAPVSGYFIDRFGPIGLSQICLVLTALGMGAVSIPSVPMVVVGTLLMGIGYGPVTPASSHLLVRTTPYSMMSVVFSIKQTGVPLGGALAGAIVPQLVAFFGWKMSAVWVAALSVILCVGLQPFRKQFDRERSHRSRFSWKNVIQAIKMTMAQSELRQIVIASFFFSTMQLCLISFIVTYLIEDIGMTLILAGMVLSAAQASGIIGRVVWGALADRFVKPRLMLGILGIGMAAGALAAAAFSPQWPYSAILIVCAVFGAAAIGWNGVYLAEVARVATPEHAGMATGGSLFFTFCGILLGLPAFSLIIETTGSYALGFGVAAMATLACGVVLAFSRASR